MQYLAGLTSQMDNKIIKITATFSEDERAYVFYAHCREGLLKKAASQQVEKALKQMLKAINVKQGFHVYEAQPFYELCQPETYGPSKKNTIVEVAIPFCLDLPQGEICEVYMPEDKYSALVHFRKIWTKNSKGSSSVDLFEEDNVTYFTETEVRTPPVPQNDEDGYEAFYQGKNVIKTGDNTAYFRYSKLSIEIDTNYSKERLKNNSKYKNTSLSEIRERTHDIVNRILDTYRLATRETHIERLSDINIKNIYFVDHNIGVYVLRMGAGIQSAVVNRSKKEIDSIRKTLKEGSPCPIDELLFLNAEASYHKRMFTLAVVESFQALEIFLENFLISQLNGVLSEKEVDQKLGQTWRTKERLKILLPEVGVKSPSENRGLWDHWCTMYDKVRNEVIHKGKEIGATETRKAVDLNREMVNWIKHN